MQSDIHTHNFSGTTTLSDGHTHRYIGITSPSPNDPCHVHFISGETTYNDAHSHNYRLETSLRIQIAGGHIHNYEGPTSVAVDHNHDMSGITSVFTEQESTEPARPVQQIQFGVPESSFRFRQFRPSRPDGPERPGPGRPSAPGQRPGVAPSTPPPSFTPSEPSAAPLALDSGAVAPCRFRFSYIWPRRGQPFWAWIVYVGRRSFAGFRWYGRSWVYFEMDLREIRSIRCF